MRRHEGTRMARFARRLGVDRNPLRRRTDRIEAVIRLATTILLLAGVPVHVVSQRLGHASPTITLAVYAHVMPGNQRDAADLFARLIKEAKA